ncbi:DUF5000 domain-containing lipoprotein [Parabacteroides sp. Marseille-P3160]|uniref:DUF5000 domain-containing lipoprotein n=1 Tax=Parabacteroides sp. Marseille-P3160 TaxID=1917887 RepID=UPI0009BB186B|nr:DUF5000 domain-containing lipoprotein [Parabacteroides sp. Marseille-P3160]
MKYYILFLIALLCITTGCKEEFTGQFPVDNTAPQNVTNVHVENIPGGSILTYNLPEEDDLLCITAVYTSPNGSTRRLSSSAYNNTITLKGFGMGRKTKVALYAVDKSLNYSDPLYVEIEPLDSPIYDVIKTLKCVEAFGGVKLYWENPSKENLVFEAMILDENKEYKHVETVYSSEATANRSIRGLDSQPTKFAMYFRDTYDNYTDTIYAELTPIFETEIDKKNFKELKLSSKFQLHSYGGGKMSAMWDNIYNVASNLFYVNVAEEEIYFAFDMGVSAKLSRFRLWGRRDFLFSLHHLRTFEVWGTNDASKTTDPDNWGGWTKIMDCESKRPSGIETGGNLTSEDEAYALAGEEYEVPIEASKYRYLKFLVHTTWGNTRAAFINEITIWGNPQ